MSDPENAPLAIDLEDQVMILLHSIEALLINIDDTLTSMLIRLNPAPLISQPTNQDQEDVPF